jgi:7-cyano-7-deazaguanine reductase
MYIMSNWKIRLKKSFSTTGWSKAELARRSGVQYDSLSKYLDGKVEQPRGESLLKLAKALDVNILWLRDGTGSISKDRLKNKSAINNDNLTQLGGLSQIPITPNDAVFEIVANPHKDREYLVRFTCPEFTSLCPVTGQPDFAHIIIDYVPNKALIESKSLKLFLSSYRNHGDFHEACTIDIAKRIIKAAKPKWLRIGGYWYPRGGIPIDVFFQTALPPKGLWIPNQGVPPYRGRG